MLLAVFFVAIVAIGAIKFSNGDLYDAVRKVAAPDRGDARAPDGIASASTAGSKGTLDVWIDERVREFGTRCSSLAAPHLGVTRSQLQGLYEKRGEVLEQMYGRLRFMENDEAKLEEAERTIAAIDDFFTGWISRLKKESSDVRGITWPLCNGDGDARVARPATPLPADLTRPATMRV